METFYKLEEARNILKISDATIRRYIKNGKLEHQKLGREYRITETALKEFVDAQNKNKRTGENSNG